MIKIFRSPFQVPSQNRDVISYFCKTKSPPAPTSHFVLMTSTTQTHSLGRKRKKLFYSKHGQQQLEMMQKPTPMDQYVAHILRKNERGSAMIQIVSDNARMEKIVVSEPKKNRRSHSVLSRCYLDSLATTVTCSSSCTLSYNSLSSSSLATPWSSAAKAVSKWGNGSHCGMRADVVPVAPVASPPFRRQESKTIGDRIGASCGNSTSCAPPCHARWGEFFCSCDESTPTVQQHDEKQDKNDQRRLLRAKCA
jgi:hypothetical protein